MRQLKFKSLSKKLRKTNALPRKGMNFNLFQNKSKKLKASFGGSLLNGKRKSKRPLSIKKPIHLILKSEVSFFNLRNKSLMKLIEKQAEKFRIKIYQLAPNCSHIHLIIKLEDEKDYVRFIRSLTSIMATRIRRLYPEIEKIFTLRPFTRIIEWGRDFNYTIKYLIKNLHEAFGLKTIGISIMIKDSR